MINISMKLQAEVLVERKDDPRTYILKLTPDCQDEYDPIVKEDMHTKLKECDSLFFLDLKVDMDPQAQVILKEEVLPHVYGKSITRLEYTNVPPFQNQEEIETFLPILIEEFKYIMESCDIQDIFIHIESWVELPKSMVDELVEIHNQYYKRKLEQHNGINDIPDCNIGVFAKYRFDSPKKWFDGISDDDLVSDQEVLSKSIEEVYDTYNRLDYNKLIPIDPRSIDPDDGVEDVILD
jgi:hypothetical protein